MNGVHDMGGTDGFGPVVKEIDEPLFHAPWEGRVFAFTRAMGYAGAWTLDETRAMQEKLPPQVYLSVSYYKRWALGFERLLIAHGLADAEEIAAGRALRPGKSLARKLKAEVVPTSVQRASFARPAQAPARFSVGDRVRTKNMHPVSATRLPRYARGRVGIIERVQGCHVYPDSVVLGKGDDPQWLYTVAFEGRELWGEDGDPTIKVSIEAFEPYLEPINT
jgi:nitrile hydratase beta subunit